MAAPPELDEYDRLVWQKGSKCCVCDKGPIFVRHHCRKCGRVVHTTDDCSSEIVITERKIIQSLSLNPDGSDDYKVEQKLPIRICNVCQKSMKKKNRAINLLKSRRSTRKCCHCSKRLGRISYHCRLCGKRVHKNKCSIKAILDHANKEDLILNPNGTDDPKKPLRFCVGCLRSLQDKRAVPSEFRRPESQNSTPPPLFPINGQNHNKRRKPRTLPRLKRAQTSPNPHTHIHTRSRAASDGASRSKRLTNLNDIFEPLPSRGVVIPKNKNKKDDAPVNRSRSPSYKNRYQTKGGRHRRAVSFTLNRAQTDIASLRLDSDSSSPLQRRSSPPPRSADDGIAVNGGGAPSSSFVVRHQRSKSFGSSPPEFRRQGDSVDQEDDEREDSVLSTGTWVSTIYDREDSVSRTSQNNFHSDEDEEDEILPAGWEECSTSDGFKYYQHIETKEVSWIFPRSSEPRIIKPQQQQQQEQQSPEKKQNAQKVKHSRSKSMPAFLHNMESISEGEELNSNNLGMNGRTENVIR